MALEARRESAEVRRTKLIGQKAVDGERVDEDAFSDADVIDSMFLLS